MPCTDRKFFNETAARVRRFAAAERLLPPRCAVVVGLSGGPDSVALLLLLRKIAPDAPLLAAHLDHRIRRGDTRDDHRFCERLCADLGVPLFAWACDVPALAKKNHLSLETAARRARYDFFADAVRAAHRKNPGRPIVVALGHHLDDQAETALHRILRGTGVAGLAAIPPRREMPVDGLASPAHIIRPLLQIGRDEILRCLAAAGQDYRTDRTNLAADYTRNRLRNELLPHLRQRYNPKISRALADLAAAARHWTRALEISADAPLFAQADPLDRWREDGTVALDAALLAAMPPAAAQHALGRAMGELKIPLGKITARHFRRLLDLLAAPAPRTVQLPGGVDCRRDGEALFLEKRGRARKITRETFALQPGAPTAAAPLDLRFALKPRRVSATPMKKFFATKSPREELLDADRLAGPLRARFARPDDAFRPLGRKNAVSLAKFLAAQGLTRRQRERAVVVADAEKIVWVVGLRLSDEIKIEPSTKHVMMIRAEKL